MESVIIHRLICQSDELETQLISHLFDIIYIRRQIRYAYKCVRKQELEGVEPHTATVCAPIVTANLIVRTSGPKGNT